MRAVVGARADRVAELTAEQWDTVTDVLLAADQLEQLWGLAVEAPPVSGVRMLVALGSRNWRPDATAEARRCDELIALARRCADVPLRTDATDSVELGADHFLGHLTGTAGGLLVVSGNQEGSPHVSIRLWSLTSGVADATTHAFETGPEVRPAGQLTVSRDERILVTVGAQEVRSWRLPSGEPLCAVAAVDPWCAVLSPDGTLLACGEGRSVRLWSHPSGAPMATLAGHAHTVTYLVMSPDGASLTSVDIGGEVLVWRLPDGTRIGGFRVDGQHGDYSRVGAVTASPDGTLLVTAWESGSSIDDDQIQVRSLPGGDLAFTVCDRIADVAVTADGSTLVTASRRGVRLWHLPSGASAGTVGGLDEVVPVGVTVAGDYVVVVQFPLDGQDRLWFRPLPPPPWLDTAVVTPVSQISSADVPRWPADGRSRAWVELIGALVRWRDRYDIVIDEASELVVPADRDIELGD